MRLLELHLRNFRQHAESSIVFPPGLTGIVGPNGAGKSTILEAIAWAIYGAEASRGTNETLRRARAGAGARVEVDLRFALGDEELRVVRTLTSAEVYAEGEDTPVASSVGGASEYLQRRLGMVRREFFNTYFTGQKELQFLASMGPAERGRFLSTVLGYDRLRVAQGLARQKRNVLRNRVEGLRAGLPDEAAVREEATAAEEELATALRRVAEGEAGVEAARQTLERVAPRWEEARATADRRTEIAGGLVAAEHDVESALREVERVEQELEGIARAEAEQVQLRGELTALPDLVRQCERLDSLSRTHERRRALAEEVRAIGLELERSLDRLARLEQAPELLTRYAAELASAREEQATIERALEEHKTAWLRDRQDAETKLQSYRDRAHELQEEIRRIREAGPDGICPTCRRPLGEDFERLVASLEEQWAEVTQDGKWWRSRYDQLTARPADVVELEERLEGVEERVRDRSRKHTRCEAAMQELETLRAERQLREERRATLRTELETLPAGYDAGEHQVAEARLEELHALEQRLAGAEAATRRKAEWEAARRAARERHQDAMTRAAAARLELTELAGSAEELETLRNEAEGAEREVRLAEVSLAEAQERLRGAERSAAVARRAERELEARLGELEREVTALRYHNELDSAFTRLRADLNARVRPELAEVASRLMAQLTDGRYTNLEIDESYRVLVVDDGLAKPVISGGEEDVANLVLRISLSQMIAERSGRPLSLLVLDEVFGSLDVVRRENVVRLLRRLGSRFEQVLLVTHLEEIRGAMDQVLRVELDEATGSSIVQWEGQGALLGG